MQDEKKVVMTIPPPQRENTLTISLADPKIDQITFTNASLRLHTMRQFLSAFTMREDHDGAGMDFQVFLRHAIGLKEVTLDGARMEFIKTAKGIYLVFEESEGKRAEGKMPDQVLGRAVPEASLGRRYVLGSGKDTVVMLRFTGKEWDMIEKAAKEFVDLPELKRKLAGSSTMTRDEAFDLQAFAAGIRAATVYRDEHDRAHYIIDHEDGQTYTVYTKQNQKERAENPLLYAGSAESEVFFVYLVQVVG